MASVPKKFFCIFSSDNFVRPAIQVFFFTGTRYGAPYSQVKVLGINPATHTQHKTVPLFVALYICVFVCIYCVYRCVHFKMVFNNFSFFKFSLHFSVHLKKISCFIIDLYTRMPNLFIGFCSLQITLFGYLEQICNLHVFMCFFTLSRCQHV